MRREANRRVGRSFLVLTFILVVAGIVLLLQDDILADYHMLEVNWLKKAAGKIPDNIRQATHIDSVLEKIGGFELDEHDDDVDDEAEDEDENLIDEISRLEQEEIEEEEAEENHGNLKQHDEDDNDLGDIDDEDENHTAAPEAPKQDVASTSGPMSGPRKYLIVFKFMEQLTKASMALEEIMVLAKELNRTLVLPRVGSSTIGLQPAVNQFPLSFYFDTSNLANTADFDAWWSEHRTNISRSIRFKNSKYPISRCRSGGPHTVTFYDKTLRFSNSTCLDPSETSFSHVRSLLKALEQEETLAFTGYRAAQVKFDVESQKKIRKLRFNPDIVDQVDLWIETYIRQPFLAIHWRTETIPTENLEACAHALVDLAQETMATKNLSLVYLATDLGPEKKSITLKDQQKKLSIYETVMEGLENPRTYRRDDNMFNTHGDTGILGIIEKLICARADYFLGLQGRCAKHSSYTRDIVAMRDENHKESEIEWAVDLAKIRREYLEGGRFNDTEETATPLAVNPGDNEEDEDMAQQDEETGDIADPQEVEEKEEKSGSTKLGSEPQKAPEMEHEDHDDVNEDAEEQEQEGEEE